MTSTSSAGSPNTLAVQPTQLPRRPLQREGAVIFPSAAEQALMDAMERSSPPPEPTRILGKRTHGQDNEQDGGDTTEPEESNSATECAQTQEPSFGNIAAATLRYATRKKLRSEQRDEVEAFLQVSSSFFDPYILTLARIPHWAVKPGYSSVSSPLKIKLIRFDLPRRLTKYRMN